MKRLIAIVPVAALLAACGTSGGGGAATATVTRTATVTAAAPANAPVPAASEPAASDPAGTGPAPDPASSASAATPDACSLLTLAEAEKVAGTPLMKPVGAGATSTGAFVECQFTGPTSGPTAQVEVYVGDGAKQQLHIDRDNLKHAFTTVPGIGDQCLQEEGYIFVEKNGLWASIHLVRLNDSKLNIVPLQTGMRQLAARLP